MARHCDSALACPTAIAVAEVPSQYVFITTLCRPLSSRLNLNSRRSSIAIPSFFLLSSGGFHSLHKVPITAHNHFQRARSILALTLLSQHPHRATPSNHKHRPSPSIHLLPRRGQLHPQRSTPTSPQNAYPNPSPPPPGHGPSSHRHQPRPCKPPPSAHRRNG